MILSVSRRTDIPAFYSKWFANRIREGFVYIRNPFNTKRISKVKITPDVVDCIVFWSKDPLPLMGYLEELKEYNYYFQFTLTPYDKDIELNLRKKSQILNTFIELSQKIGKDKVILRYDPVLFTDRYTIDFHKRSFEKLCSKVGGYTNKIIISFLDEYKKVKQNMKNINLKEITNEDIYEIASFFASSASVYSIKIETCAEEVNLSQFGINHGRCIDGELIDKIAGYPLKNMKKDGNRENCLCHECIDIGQYDTCIHGCLYCYANVNKELAKNNNMKHNPDSPVLFGDYDENSVKERKGVESFRGEESNTNQIEFDMLK